MIQRNRELEAREALRQVEEHRAERAQRDRAAEAARVGNEHFTAAEAERWRVENAKIKRDKENLASMMRNSQSSSRRKSDNEEVFEDASGGEET